MSNSILDLFSIKDKNVIITGATGGIGFEITVALAEAGADIVSIEMPRDPGSADLRRAVEATGRRISAFECNLKDPQSIKDTFAAIWKAGVVPDILVNCAGITRHMLVENTPVQDLDDVMAINFRGTYLAIQEFGREMFHLNRSGKIINFASIKRGIHVLCEKPVAETSSQVEEIINVANAHPNVKVMIGFMRRFDDNYLDALSRIQNGEIGQPLIIRSQAYDTLDTSAPYKQYLQNSGGIFLDATIHDIDLALSFFGRDARPKAAWAAGLTAYHKELSEQRDADNAVGICEFHDGKIAFFYNSRTSPRGFDNQTEIVGMDGKISINLLSRQNKLELSDKDGIRVEPTRGWSDRYAESFVTGVNVFTDAVLHGKTVPVTLLDALKSLRIAESLQYSLKTGEKVEFDEAGQGILNINQ